MATKTKLPVNKSATKKNSFKFTWWMAVAGVIIIAVVGIAVVRFSRASGPSSTAKYATVVSNNLVNNNKSGSLTIKLSGDGSTHVLVPSLYYAYAFSDITEGNGLNCYLYAPSNKATLKLTPGSTVVADCGRG